MVAGHTRAGIHGVVRRLVSGNGRQTFNKKAPVQWGGDYATLSAEVSNYLANDISPGDIVIAYQTDLSSIVGYCTVTKIAGAGDRKLWLQPFEVVNPPFRIHDHKTGTVLEQSIAVRGPVMLRELSKTEMKALVSLAGSPQRVLRGQPASGGWKPQKAPPGSYTQ